jgi:hypothetical protein
MGRPIIHTFHHLHKADPKEYNRLYQREYRKRNAKPEEATQHLLLTHLTALPEGVKPIPEWPTYYASEDGRIFRDNRETAKLGHGKIIELTQRWNPKVKYYQVQPYQPNGKRKLMYTHRMVLAAFTGEMKHEMYVNHKNFDRGDNSAKNLEWVSFEDNLQHYYDYGGHRKDYISLGSGRKMSKTKYSDLKPLMKHYIELGWAIADIAKLLDVDASVIHNFKISKGYKFF